jgi:hypothetical protein
MLYIAALVLTTLVGAGLAWLRPKSVADDDAARRAAILARIKRIGVAPDDLRNLR